MGVVDTIGMMNRELATRCAAASMQFDCGAGGNINSPIAIVAEAPGYREVQQKQPLIGQSGRMLWDVLRKDGLTRNHVYITNVVKRMLVSISDDMDDKIKLSKGELDHWRYLLIDELSLLPNIRYVVVLGDLALQALMGHTGITKWRGSVIDTHIDKRPVKLIATFNPAHILREPRMEIVFRMDCGKIKRVMDGKLNVPDIITHINPTAAQAHEYLAFLESQRDPIGHDIETMGGETACVGFAHSPTEGMCINFRTQGSNLYTLEEERNLRLHIQRVLSNDALRFVAQNGMFDASWSWFKDRIRVHGYSFDTMLAHHTLYPPLPHNLGFITAQYTDYPYYKDEREEWLETNNIDDFWRYNIKDCCITLAAGKAMADELEQTGLAKFFYNHVMRLQRHLVQMTVGGIKCDVGRKLASNKLLTASVAEAKELCQAAAREATGIGDYEFNPRSVPDLRKLLFNDLGLVGRGASVDKENRARMRKHPRTSEAARVVIDRVNSYIEQAKFLSVYINSRIDDDGRFRCEYKQTGVSSAPGRLSSSQTAWKTGLNQQNIPDDAKDMFVIDPGYVATYYDMAQIEARIVAYLANIIKWKHQFELARLHPGTYDAHCALASDMYGIPYDEVPKIDWVDGKPTIRYTAKRCRHGLNYRMAVDRLATVTGLPMVDAERAYRLYHRETPELVVWWDDLANLVRRDRRIVTCLGRRWILLERFTEDALEAIVAFEPQSTNGDHTASVIYQSQEDERWPSDARFLVNVHDANIAIHRAEDSELVQDIMRKYAEAPLWINSVKNRLDGIDKPEPLIVPAEFAITEPDEHGVMRWSTLKKSKPSTSPHPADHNAMIDVQAAAN